jgi:hypothetical protein
MSGLDEKGLRAAIFPNGENPLWTDMQRGAVDETISRVVRYLASATPADVGELVERLLHDHVQLGKMTEQASFLASGAVRVNDPSSLMADLRDAATALERVTRERDEAHLRTAYLEEEVVRTRDAAVERVRTAEAKLAEALARLETVEAETRELRARNDPMRVLGDPRVGVTIDEASLKELKRVLATIGGATP